MMVMQVSQHNLVLKYDRCIYQNEHEMTGYVYVHILWIEL